jgi:hypothetical protein
MSTLLHRTYSVDYYIWLILCKVCGNFFDVSENLAVHSSGLHWNSVLLLLMSGWSSAYLSIHSRFSFRHLYCRYCNIYEVAKMQLDSHHFGEQHYQHGCHANLWAGSSTEVCMATDHSKVYIFIKLYGNKSPKSIDLFKTSNNHWNTYVVNKNWHRNVICTWIVVY